MASVPAAESEIPGSVLSSGNLFPVSIVTCEAVYFPSISSPLLIINWFKTWVEVGGRWGIGYGGGLSRWSPRIDPEERQNVK